jgi:hypothetical protein
MTRKGEILEFSPQDGLTPWQTRKLNENFKSIAGLLDQAGIVSANQEQQIVASKNYDKLINKPTITEPVYLANPPETNTVVIQGDNSFDDLGMKHLSNVELQDIINLVESTM